jgi:hypothetical protein
MLLRFDWAYAFQTLSILTLRTCIHLMSPFFLTSVTFCNDAMALQRAHIWMVSVIQARISRPAWAPGQQGWPESLSRQ